MNGTLLKALIASVPVIVLLVYALTAFSRYRASWTALLIAASFCLGVVVLTHIAEALHLLPMMGWGDPHSVGHYIDLSTAIAGVVLIALGVLLRVRTKIA